MADDIFPPIETLARQVRLKEQMVELEKQGTEEAKAALKELQKMYDQTIKNSVARREGIRDIEYEMEMLREGKVTREEEYRLMELKIERNRLLKEEYKAQGKLKSKEVKELDEETEKLKLKLEMEKKRKENQLSILTILKSIGGEYAIQIDRMTKIDTVAAMFGETLGSVVKTNEKLAATTSEAGLMTAEMGMGLEEYAIGYTEMAEAIGTLQTSMTVFSGLDDKTRLGLAQSAAKWKNLNVSTEVTAKNFDILNKSLKFNASEVVSVSDKMVKLAGSGISAQKIMADFPVAMEQLAFHGKKAVDIFVDLERQSKAFGVGMSDLLQVVGEGWDTYEGAANKAGKLNAILGGDYLNSVEMLNTTESERLEILRKTLTMAGIQFDALSKQERQAITGALEIKNQALAAQMLGNMSLEARLELEKQARTQEELDAAQKAAADTLQQLRLVFNNLLIVLHPVATTLKEIITWMSKHKEISAFILGIILLVRTFVSFKIVLGILPLLLAKFGVATAAAGTAAGAGSKGLLLAGLAILLIGGGVALAAYGMSLLVKSIADLISGIGEKGGRVLLSIAFGIWALVSAIAAFAAIGITGIGFAGLLVMKAAISGLIGVINEIPSGVEFTAKVKTFSDIGKTIELAAASPEKMRPATEFVSAAKDFYVAQRTSKDAENDALVQAIKKIVAPATSAGGEATKSEVPVRMKIENGPELRGWLLGARASLIGQ